MDTQQMMELLLARINASVKEHMQEMTARKETKQETAEVNRKADQAKTDAINKEMMAEMRACREEMGAETEAIRTEKKAI
jgi:hypothetical protein